MVVKSRENRPIKSEDDIAAVRTSVKRIVALLNFGIVAQTKIVTAASELARNTLEHGKGGAVEIQLLDDVDKVGVKMIFEDQGPGISDVSQAMEDGYTTGGGMGLGLGGARRLMDEFTIESKPGEGTRISAAKWDHKG